MANLRKNVIEVLNKYSIEFSTKSKICHITVKGSFLKLKLILMI